jgi:hypothetical protein
VSFSKIATTSSASASPRWTVATAVGKGLAFVVPWGIIEVAAGKHGYLGYTVGLFAGILCMHAVPPREKTLGRWLIIGIVMSLVHPLLAVFARAGR